MVSFHSYVSLPEGTCKHYVTMRKELPFMAIYGGKAMPKFHGVWMAHAMQFFGSRIHRAESPSLARLATTKHERVQETMIYRYLQYSHFRPIRFWV